MAKPLAVVLGLALLVLAGALFAWHGQDQAARTAKAEETAKANAAAVSERSPPLFRRSEKQGSAALVRASLCSAGRGSPAAAHGAS